MTPAPWTLKQHATNHQTLTGATAGLIADIHKDEDARLLAAAPDLFKALREIVAAVESGDADGYSPSGDWFREAKATLSKVSGEQA